LFGFFKGRGEGCSELNIDFPLQNNESPVGMLSGVPRTFGKDCTSHKKNIGELFNFPPLEVLSDPCETNTTPARIAYLYDNKYKSEYRNLPPCSILPSTREISDVTKTVHSGDIDVSVTGYYIRNSELATTNLKSQPDPCIVTSSSPAWNILG